MAEYSLNVRFLPCAHTATEWASSTYKDKILKSGEIGYEKNTGRYKIGDGTNKWANLPWAKATPYGDFIPLNTSGGIGSIAGDGKYWYCLIATIKISNKHINRPITFEISGRGFLTSIVQVMFQSIDHTDPKLSSFTTNGYNKFYIVKSDTSTWKIYGMYTEVWGSLVLHRITGSGSNIGVTVNLENVDALPAETTQASYYGNVSYATNAGSATQANKLTVNAGSSTNPVYFSGGVPTACSGRTVPGIKSASEVTTLGWGTNNNYVADISLLSYWNGAYSGTSSNLAYCKQGAFGTIVTKAAGDYLAVGGTAVAAKKLANYYSARQESANLTTDGSGGVINFKATGSMKTGKPMTDGHILHFYWDNKGGWDAQFFIPTGNANNYAPQWRGMNNKTWQDWRTFLDSGNYTSYTVKKDGTGASGTWGINISGNAATATKATQDGSGNTITSTYLKLTGGTLTISSYYGLKIKRSDANGSAISYLNSNGAIGGAGFLSDGNFQISSGENTNGNIFKASTTAATFPGTVTATKFIGNLTGNADTAGKWSTARKITLTGSVTGSVSIDGSGDVSLATTTNHTHGLLHINFNKKIDNTTTDSGWSMINSAYKGYILMSLRTQTNAPAWIQNNYAAGIAFGGDDTKGVLSMAYDSPKITFAGGNGTKPVWYFTLTGTSATTYNLDTFAKKDGSNASGTWGISITGNAKTATSATSATSATTAYTGRHLPIAFYGSDTAGTAGWYKVGTFSQSGYSDYNLNLLITSGCSRQAQGLLHIHTRCSNGTTIGIQAIKWMYRYGFEVGHVYAKDNGNNTWSLYVYQSNNQHGRVQVQILTQTGTATSQYDLTLTSNGTPETSAPTGGTAATDGGISNQANTLATARTINGTSFNGSANITTANWGTARTLTVGNTGKSVNGSSNVFWTLAEIGAVAKTGDTMTGPLTISHATTATMTSATTNPRIVFSENGEQPVILAYTDYDNYRSPAGLKVLGGSNASPAWFEVEGNLYASTVTASTFIGSLTGTATNANWLNTNSSLTFGASGLQYFNLDGTAGTNPSTNNTPETGWYHILRMNHGNGNGYFADIATPLNTTTGIYWRQIRYGSNYGWYKLLDSNNYSTNITNLTKGLTVSNGSLTPLTIKGGVSGNLESSISYTHPEVSSSNNWVVGMGTGGTGYGYFGFWNNAYGNVMRLSNNGSAYVSNAIYFGGQVSSNDGKVRLFSDSEGGNISLVSPNNIEYQIDTISGEFRMYRRPTDGSSYVNFLSVRDSSGHIYNADSKVICARNFTLSGNTLYITST